MPTFCVSVDDQVVAMVNTDGYELLHIRLDGRFDRPGPATLDVSGGSFPPDGPSRYLYWVSELPLLAGQTVAVAMLVQGASSHAGKTIDELFPDEPPCTISDFTLTDSMYDEIARRPSFREQLSFHFGSSSGADCAGRTGADEDSVTFGVLWHWTEAATARVSVRSSSLQDLRERRPGSRHVDELLQSGGKVSFTLLSA